MQVIIFICKSVFCEETSDPRISYFIEQIRNYLPHFINTVTANKLYSYSGIHKIVIKIKLNCVNHYNNMVNINMK